MKPVWFRHYGEEKRIWFGDDVHPDAVIFHIRVEKDRLNFWTHSGHALTVSDATIKEKELVFIDITKDYIVFDMEDCKQADIYYRLGGIEGLLIFLRYKGFSIIEEYY